MTLSLPVKMSQAEVTEGDSRVRVPNAERTIARKMPAFRRCFERMNASGRVSLAMTIVPDGVVARAEVNGPVARIIADCIEAHALQTVFSQPEGGRTARLLVPVSVIRQSASLILDGETALTSSSSTLAER